MTSLTIDLFRKEAKTVHKNINNCMQSEYRVCKVACVGAWDECRDVCMSVGTECKSSEMDPIQM